MRIKNVAKTVENILESDPKTRNDDILLYYRVCMHYNPNCANMSFKSVLSNLDNLGLPNMWTVSRSRRKLQEERKDLRATDKVLDARYEAYKEVLDYVSK